MVAERPARSLGVVSHALPPGTSGYQIVLEELLGDLPVSEVVLLGIGSGPWGNRLGIRLPVPRLPSRLSESLAAAFAVAAVRCAVSLLPRLLPPVHRVFATLDPTIGVASRWARACGAELWIYGIDLHCSEFWGAGSAFRGTLKAWRTEAFEQATQAFALSHRMADWMRCHGLKAPIELLPPLIDVGAPAPPFPNTAPLLYCGWVYRANARPLKWIERAATEVRPDVTLRLLTHNSREQLASLGLNVNRWSIASVPAREVAAEVSRCGFGIIALDPEFEPREQLQVAWPTKLRDYLAAGRPVICIAADDYAAAEIAAHARWAILANDEASTRGAVHSALSESAADMADRCEAAHAFARRTMDNRELGRRWRERVLAQRTP